MLPFEDLLQAETERLGFPLYGITAIQPPPHYAAYQRWIHAGLHAGMAYLASERAMERRKDPTLVQQDAGFLLVAGMRYPSAHSLPMSIENEALGRVAAYAWGEDYHEVIPPRLKAVGEAIEKYLGRPVTRRIYTDTGPVLERDFAQKAGMGWAGKNTCLISPHSGSYYLLGEIFLDQAVEEVLDLTPSFSADRCGACTRCIDACPTAAIRPDRTIESARCISYLTIENKGPIPTELRPGIGEWIFGCDICQMVCPWNLRFAAGEGHPALAAHPENAQPVLRQELCLSPQEFNRKFRRSPVLRAKRRGYLRNVAVALGNARDTASAPDLIETLENEAEPLVRAHAAWALGQLQTQKARSALENALARETAGEVTEEIENALQR